MQSYFIYYNGFNSDGESVISGSNGTEYYKNISNIDDIRRIESELVSDYHKNGHCHIEKVLITNWIKF